MVAQMRFRDLAFADELFRQAYKQQHPLKMLNADYGRLLLMAKRYRDMHRTGKRRDIDPCGTCNNFWPSFRSLSTIDAVRTGIEYCSYVARHRPTGVKRPLNGKKERIPVTSLVTLRRRDDL